MGKKVEWDGVEYPSVRAAAKACGISKQAMHARFNKGYSHSSDLKTIRKGTCKSIVWNGVFYPRYRDAAIALGVTSAKISQWARLGYSCDDDLAHRKKGTRSKSKFDIRNYDSVRFVDGKSK